MYKMSLKSKLNKINSAEWLGICLISESLLCVPLGFLPASIREKISAIIFSGYLGFIGLLVFSCAFVFLMGCLVGHFKSRKI